MARSIRGIQPQQVNILARQVLLDALLCLREHLNAVILVGAQAVYAQVQQTGITAAGFTTDADLAINPASLLDEPHLDQLLTQAHFTRDAPMRQLQPGTWYRTVTVEDKDVSIPIDLLAPQTMAPGHRAAKLPPHAKNTIRLVPGIELATIDYTKQVLASLSPHTDPRRIGVNVAGPAALLVAKAFKIHDRLQDSRPSRLQDKDAGDVYQLMAATNPYVVAEKLTELTNHPRLGDLAVQGLDLLIEQFGSTTSPGVAMALRAMATQANTQRLPPLMTGYVAALKET